MAQVAPDVATKSLIGDALDSSQNATKIEASRQTADGLLFELELRNLDRFVNIKAGTCRSAQKQILHGFNARFSSGELCAIMGGSGGGKSSLLSEISQGNPNMYLNGHALPTKYKKMVCVIPQADILFPALTPRQALRYSAMLRLPAKTNASKIEGVVDRIIKDLGLTKCKDTPVGDDNVRGVSGGERKRVSIGTELVVNPKILLVDEPSSGLDSTTAESVVAVLSRLAKEKNQMVICTIHQPSYKLFSTFDKLLMLHHGRVVYHGQTNERLHSYFSSIGFKAPEYENPLDYYMRILQERDEEDQEFFANKWAALDDDQHKEIDTERHPDSVNSKPVSDEEMQKITAKNPWLHQYKTLARRFADDTLRDKQKFAQALGMKLGVAIMMGIVFIDQARSDDYATTFTRTSPLFFLTISGVLDTAFAAILLIPLIRPLLVREYRNGAYSISALFMAQITNSLLFDTISSLSYAVAVPMVGLFPSAGQFLTYLLTMSLVSAFGSGLGLLLGSTSKDVQDAQNKMIPVIMPLLLFSGFLIPLDQIPKVFRFLYYLSPFQWALSALLITEFDGVEFSDKSTGTEYLETSLGLHPEDIWRNLCILAGLVIAMLIFAFVLVTLSVQRQAKQT